MKTFIVSEIIWSIYTAAIVIVTHAVLLPAVFYLSGLIIYGLATLFVKGLDRYHQHLLEKLAEKGLMSGDLIVANAEGFPDTPFKVAIDPGTNNAEVVDIKSGSGTSEDPYKIYRKCGNCDC